MVAIKNNRLWIALGAAIVGLTGLRLFMAPHTELIPEEAYYWTYAQHPSLGYFDHPPMVSWIVSLGTRVFGDTEFGVRIVNLLLWVGSCLMLLATARQWFGERVAVGAALLFVLCPVFLGMGFLVTPDGPLIFFWTMTLYFVSRALQTQRAPFWWLAGIAFGGALLSKYYAIVLAPSLLWFLLRSPRHRFWLKRPQPWLAMLVALVVFSPVIVWNAQHEWASFAFQSSRTIGQKGTVLARLGGFWGAQLGVLNPLGFALMTAAAWRAGKRGWLVGEDPWNFAASFGLPVFCLFAAAAFKTDVHLNWTAPAFLSLSLAASAIWLTGLDSENPSRRRWWQIGSWIGGFVSLAFIILAHVSLTTDHPKFMAYSNAGGWRKLAAITRAAEQELTERTGQKPFIIGADKYNTAAELGFYLGEPQECVNTYAFGARGLGYRYWTDLRQFEGRPAIIVTLGLKPAALALFREHFEHVDEPRPLPGETRGRARSGTYYLTIGYGYRQARLPAVGDASLD